MHLAFIILLLLLLLFYFFYFFFLRLTMEYHCQSRVWHILQSVEIEISVTSFSVSKKRFLRTRLEWHVSLRLILSCRHRQISAMFLYCVIDFVIKIQSCSVIRELNLPFRLSWLKSASVHQLEFSLELPVAPPPFMFLITYNCIAYFSLFERVACELVFRANCTVKKAIYFFF